MSLLLGRIVEKGSDARQLSGRRRGAEATCASIGEECAEVGCAEVEQA
jgi:hypothetical protein